MERKTAAIYARYSSDLQDQSSIEDQIAMCVRAATVDGYQTPLHQRYTDAAQSGATVVLRKGYQAMVEAACRKEFDVLFVENLSRLSRNLGDTQKLVETLLFHEIDIIEAAHGTVIDPTGAALKGLVAQLTREQTAQMVKRGLDGVVRSGFSAGGKAYGYQSAPKAAHEKQRGGLLEILPDEAEIVREIFELYSKGETPRAIAEKLNCRGVAAPRGTRWAASCINGEKARGSGILNNELYRGVIVWNKNRMVTDPQTGKRVSRKNPISDWVRCPAPQYRIVTDELWEIVKTRQSTLSKAPRQRARAAKRVFSGVLKCGACGAGMSLKGADKTGRNRVHCTRAKESGDCPNPRSYYIEEIEKRVLHEFQAELREPHAIATFLEAYETEMKSLRASVSTRREEMEKELAAASAKATRLNNLLMDGRGDPERIDRELKALLIKEHELKAALSKEVSAPTVHFHPAARDRYLKAVERLHEIIGADGQSHASMVIREVVDAVIMHPTSEAGDRQTQPPTIEIVGRLRALLGEDFMVPKERGAVGSGGGKYRERITC